MANRIRVLDEATINKIAAGEVVERPASVVKELVENSLDAGSTAISVSVEDGGRKFISVRDDGCGMSSEDAKAAFERHATSKIVSLDDLQRLASYGFRGEALSSIAAVSKVTLKTRERDSSEGTQVVAEAGKIIGSSPTGCPPGTQVQVEDLFLNVPARKKSMKSRNVELAHCREVMVGYTLSRPGLSFSFMSDGDTELVHVTAEGMKGSLSAAFGPKTAENMLFGEAEDEGIRVEGYVGRLEHTRSSLSELKLFVNDRAVRSTKLASAVVGAYGSKLMKDRYPVGVVRIFIDSASVDVNVHPSKREVRFDDEAKVAAAVKRSIEKAIEGPDLSFKYDLTKFSESFDPGTGVPASAIVDAVQTTLKIREPLADGDQHLLIVPLAQIMDTYILAESKGNLLLVDQHAASERIVYEAVLHSIETGKEISQTLITPLVIRLSASEERVMEENREALEKAGFKIEPFGRGAHALRSIPTVLGVAQGESAFRNILDDLGRMAPSKKLGLEVIWRVACHTAVRAGEVLSEAQMRQLVSELVKTKSPFTCEHGRPTMVVLSPADLEKLFKRRV
ncbi:MAG: DNA mismatch repair endonuclease MutL [Candidatus Thermoplasmatota archaeon]|nr:DNA mismatch repair endonuclease MutL [Candidatus Thermoplasmatota archaeon]